MPRVRILTTTGLTDDHVGFQRLPAGTTLDVTDDVARRWQRNRIAEPWDGPLGVVSAEEAHASPADLDAEIKRLTDLRDRQSTRAAPSPAVSASLPADPYVDPKGDDPFAHAKLTEKQHAALSNAGFKTRAHLDRASDDEVLEALGGGKGSEAALGRLRGA